MEDWDTLEAGTAGVVDTDLGEGIRHSHECGNGAERRGLASWDPLARLEKNVLGERKAMTEHDQMEALLSINAGTMGNDAASNAALRRTYRTARKAKKRRVNDAMARGLGKGIQIAEATEEDVAVARAAFRNSMVADRKARHKETDAFSKLRSGSIFGQKTDKRERRKSSVQAQTMPSSEKLNRTTLFASSKGIASIGQESVLNDPPIRLIPIVCKDDKEGSLKTSKSGVKKIERCSALSALDAYGSDTD